MDQFLFYMLGRREPAELSDFSVHGHDCVEVVLLRDGHVDDVTSVVAEVFGGGENFCRQLWISVESLFDQRARTCAVAELVSAHMREQLSEHWLRSLLGQSSKEVRGEELRAHEMSEIGQEQFRPIRDVFRLCASGNERWS